MSPLQRGGRDRPQEAGAIVGRTKSGEEEHNSYSPYLPGCRLELPARFNPFLPELASPLHGAWLTESHERDFGRRKGGKEALRQARGFSAFGQGLPPHTPVLKVRGPG